MSRKNAVKTVLILIVAPILAASMLFFLGAAGLASAFMLTMRAGEAADSLTDQIIFINEGSAEILSLEITQGDQLLSREMAGKRKITVDWELWPCVVTATDRAGQTAQLSIGERAWLDLARDRWYVIAQDGPEGTVLTLSYTDDLERVVRWGKKKTGLELSDGLIRKFVNRHGGVQGDGDSLLVMTFTAERGAALEQAMSQTEGWHRFPTHELVSGIFYGKSCRCRDMNGEPYVPPVEHGWYFFRDTFHVQHGDEDAHQWDLEGRTRLPGNFDAAIYDSDSGTLYLFEYDS